jgi:hypothetical protein
MPGEILELENQHYNETHNKDPVCDIDQEIQ